MVEGTDAAPTRQSEAVYEELATAVNVQLRAAQKLLTDDIAAFNKMVRDSNIPAVTISKPKSGVE